MQVVSIVGGIALFVMGVVLLRNAKNFSLIVKDNVEFDYGSILGGAFFSIISPGFLIWWVTIGFSIILKSLMFGIIGFVVVAVGHWLADIGWHWLVSYFVNKGKFYLKDSTYQRMIRFLAFGIILIGVYFMVGIN